MSLYALFTNKAYILVLIYTCFVIYQMYYIKYYIINWHSLIVGDKTLQILQSLKHDYEMNSDFDNINTVYLAYSVLLILSILMIVMYLRKFEISIYQSNNKLTFIYFNLSLLIIISTYIINTKPDYIYIVPYSLLPLLFMTFFKRII